jgi:hypothetical protein
MARIFFDTEFTGLHKDTTLMSIGLVAEDGNSFYAEFVDYDTNQVNEWIQKNVINNLWTGKSIDFGHTQISTDLEIARGDKSMIKLALLSWLNKFDSIEWVSDVCHYDFVLLIDLVYKHALNMPYGKHCAACHDINQDIAKFYGISEIEAFDLSREQILKDANIEIKGAKHNSLYDAKVIKEIYTLINK